ncbi:hypothetical protein UFOVP111_141 [uncultured Caudovirales phage]|uniref:Uncharacterized protein n=1 Tax=uncultured Caudovirales phage TaxID=2100421 RepID=A0A6J5L6W8_9CAUD|nr:hypothetical protein UFOVP111_141 [uncultured Caudovirales phage]
MRVTKQDVHIHEFLGTWMCEATVGYSIYAYREHAQYYNCTKQEALRLFLERCNTN